MLVAFTDNGLSTYTLILGSKPLFSNLSKAKTSSCVRPRLNAGIISLPFLVTQVFITTLNNFSSVSQKEKEMPTGLILFGVAILGSAGLLRWKGFV